MKDPACRESGGCGGGGAIDDLLPKTAQECNRLVAESFIGAGGYEGSGGFRPFDLTFASYRNSCLEGIRARARNAAGNTPATTTPATQTQLQKFLASPGGKISIGLAIALFVFGGRK